MSDKIISVSTTEPVKGVCSQFDYRGFTVSMSTAFKSNPEVAAWSNTTIDDQNFATVQDAIQWIDKLLY